MKQLKLAILLASFMNLFVMKALAYEFAYNGIYYDWDYTHGVTGFQVTYKFSTYSEEELRDLYYSDYSGNIVIPSSVSYYGTTYPVVSIGDHAFSGCEDLNSVIVPSSVTTIGYGAFEGCKSFSVTLPSSINRMYYDSFAGDYNVINYDLNINITDLKAWCEMDSEGIGRPYRLYLNGSLLTNLDIPEGITTIHNYAFTNCCQITEINIPEGVTSIGEYAFCFPMSEPQVTVTLPSSITSIGYSAFDSYLTSVTIKRESPIAISWGAFKNTFQATLYVPFGSKAAYEAADYWKDFKEIVEIQEENSIINFADANVKALCVSNWDADGDGELSKDEASTVTNLKYVFKERQNITSFDELQYFTGLTNISANAFYGCSGLTHITLPTSLTSIGEYSFGGCSSLTSITIPSSVKSIGSWAFAGSGLSSVVFPNGLTSIGSYAFHGTDITSVAIPSTVTVIGDAAFGYCQKLSSIAVESGNTKYSSYDNCNAIIDTETNTLIAGCKNTNIPSSVVKIANVAFRGSQMTALDIPLSVEVIGAYAFNWCDKLVSVSIPSNVTNIGEWAFNGCSNLVSVTMQRETPVSIDAYTFSNRANATLYVPAGSKAAYEAADYWKEFKEIVEMEEVIETTDISQMDNVIYIDPTEGLTGMTVKLNVKMKNSVTAEGFGFDLYLPDGVTVATDEDGFPMVELSTQRTTAKKTNSFDAAFQSDGSLRVLAASTNGSAISGNDGEVCLITINIADDMEEGDYPILLKNIAISDVDAVSHRTEQVKITLTISAYTPGDANNDGAIDVSDFTATAHYLLGNTPTGFNVKAADANGDGVVDVADLTAVAHIILYGSVYRPPSAPILNSINPQ